jgi:methyl-accepting chemotaxis protein
MKTVSIQNRLRTGLSLIVAFFVVQAALVWWAQDGIRRDVVDTTKTNTLASAELSQLAILAQQIRRYEKEYFVYVGNADGRAKYEKEWSGAAAKITAGLDAMGKASSPFDAAERSKVTEWRQAADFYMAEMRKVFAAATERAGQTALDDTAAGAAPDGAPGAAAKAAAPAVAPVTMLSPIQANDMIKAGKDRFSDVVIKGVAAMSEEKSKATLALGDVANKGFSTLLLGVLATVALGVLIALALLVLLPKSVSAPIETLTQAVDNMSRGALDQAVSARGVVEFDGLAKALDRMRVAQQSLVARMRRTSASS